MTKHTPAPWVARGTRIYDADGEEVAVATRASPRNRPHARETAQLIAAVPETVAERDRLKSINADLYETLIAVREMIENMPSGIDYDADEDDPSPDDMTAHIAGLICQKINVTTSIARKAIARANEESKP